MTSPMYEQVFDLRTGVCLDDSRVVVPVFPIRREAAGDRMEVVLSHEHGQ
ncbi:nitrite reductase (NAD(P)H) small subunit [Actinomadura rubrisoli]